VELYRYYRYKTFDDKKIQEDARLALEDVTSRYLAKKLTDLKTVDVLLRSDDIAQIAEQLIEDFSFRQVFNKANTKKIGDDLIAGVEKDKLTISLAPYSKADSFDAEGINLEPCTIVENGKVVAYFGGNQFASYLKMAPTGQLPKVILTPGKTEEKEMRKTPYLEILDLSGIQIDVLAHYIGGEVRLANYFDGTKLHPVSDFSFSGNLDEVLKNVVLSKETKDTVTYSVPKIIKLPKMNLI
jgi:predicted Zn-dependent protease